MKKVLFVLVTLGIALPVFAEKKKEEKQDDRWKITFSGSVVGPGQVWGVTNPDYCENCRDSFQSGLGLFTNRYLGNFFVDLDSVNVDIPAYAYNGIYSVPTVEATFRTRFPNNLRSLVGDEVLLQRAATVRDIGEAGAAVGGSLEYRMIGGLWAAFSFNVSRDMFVSRSERAEFIRVESITPGAFVGPSYRQRWDPEYWTMIMSRHHLERDSEHRHRFYTFALLAKYDLTRGNDNWSVMPQVGADLLLERRVDHVTTRISQYARFADDRSAFLRSGQPSGAAEHTSLTYWLERVRPVTGLSVELYPGGKNGHVGFFIDGRYELRPSHETDTTFYHGREYSFYEYEVTGRENVVPYRYETGATDWHILLGGLVRF